MIRLLSLFLTIIITKDAFANLSSSSLKLIHNHSKEKELDWKIKTFVIEKKIKGYQHKFYQTWIALPPLLEVLPDKPNYDILENLKAFKSPLFNDEEVGKVLIFEHLSSLPVLELKKSNKKSSNNLILKVDASKKKLSHVTKNCMQLGLIVDGAADSRLPFSIDCKKMNKDIYFSIVGSQVAGKNIHFEKEIKIILREKNHVKGFFNLKPTVVIGSFFDERLKETKKIEIKFKKIETNKSKFYTQFKNNQPKAPPRGSNDSWAEKKTNFLFNLGLFGSKQGAEVDVLALYGLNQPLGHISFHMAFPVRFVGSGNEESVFFETGVSYNKTINFFGDYVVTFGGGGKQIILGTGGIYNDSALGLELRVSFSKRSFVYESYQYSSSLTVVPLYFDYNTSGARFLWEFANFVFHNLDTNTLSISFRYSHILYNTDNLRFSDSKILSGVILTW